MGFVFTVTMVWYIGKKPLYLCEHKRCVCIVKSRVNEGESQSKKYITVTA